MSAVPAAVQCSIYTGVSRANSNMSAEHSVVSLFRVADCNERMLQHLAALCKACRIRTAHMSHQA